MTAVTPNDAKGWNCPLARTWADVKGNSVNPCCRADACPVWRWVPLSANDPRFKEAVSARMADQEAKSHKTAVQWVMEHRADLGLPTSPTHGYCGLGAEPRA